MQEIEDINPPHDWESPRWHVVDRVHNWRNYASEKLKEEWPNFSLRQRMTIAACLDDIAGNEHWD